MSLGEEVFTSEPSDDEAESSDDELESSSSSSVRLVKRFKASTASSAIRFKDPPVNHNQVPRTSGCMDFVEWVISAVLSVEDRAALATKFKTPVELGSMCSGMATEDIAMHAIQTGLALSGVSTFSYMSSFKAESDPKKAAFLRRRLHKDVTVFDNNAKVTEYGNAIVPTCSVLTCGIVCKNISSLSSDQKSVSDESGSSGKSLSEMLASLSRWAFEQRPALVILECTTKLSQHRKVDGDTSGTEYITAKLEELGYVGSWRLVSANMFYLPQSRLRIYGLFLKVLNLSGQSIEARRQDLHKAMGIISDSRLHSPEPLSKVLGRAPIKHAEYKNHTGKSYEEALVVGAKWPGQHDAMRRKLKLPEELSKPPQRFLQQALNLMVPRAADALWIKLTQVILRRGTQWDKGCYVVPVTMSIRFGSVNSDDFPCLTPGSKYVMVQDGVLSTVSAASFLALQGVQSRELTRFKMNSEADRLLRDLAGNAFTSNVVAIFLLAGLLVM